MTFPLMHGYDHINVVAELDPVAAVRDRELGERILRYPKLLPAGSPNFGHAMQKGKEWRIGCLGSDDPSSARYSLAVELRLAAAEEEDSATASRAISPTCSPGCASSRAAPSPPAPAMRRASA